MPDKYGSFEKPSQFLPAYTVQLPISQVHPRILPEGFCQAVQLRVPAEHEHQALSIPCLFMIKFRGVSSRPWNWNIPRAFPLAYIRDVSHVEPVVMPAGKAVTPGAYLTLPIFSTVLMSPPRSLTPRGHLADRAQESQLLQWLRCCQHKDLSPIPFQLPRLPCWYSRALPARSWLLHMLQPSLRLQRQRIQGWRTPGEKEFGPSFWHRKKDEEKKIWYSRSKNGTGRGKRNFDMRY